MTLCFKKVHKHCIEVQYCNFVAKVLIKMLCDCLLIQTLHVLATFDFFFQTLVIQEEVEVAVVAALKGIQNTLAPIYLSVTMGLAIR